MAALLAVVFVVVAFTPFTQTVPTVDSVGNMVESCTSLVQADPAGSLALGYDGGVTFDCDTLGAAFNVSGGTVLVTPSFALPNPTNYTDFYIYDSTDTLVSAENCTDLTGFQLLETGVEESVPVGDWNYCAQVANAQSGNMGTFDVDWDV